MIYRYFLAFWILTSSAVAVQSTQYGLLGETVTFKTDIRDPPDDILWKHNGNKVVQFDGNQQTEYNPFQKRITLDWSSADLEINHLTHSDSGQYELDAAKGGGLTRHKFELKVLDRVTKPTITCNMSDGSSSDKSGSEATLMCFADPSQSLNYEWSQPGKIQPGQILTIPLGTEHDDKVYNCTASNRLSKEIATFTAKDCYPVGASAGLIAGVVIGVIALLLCVLVAVFCALKHKEKNSIPSGEQKTPDEEEAALLPGPESQDKNAGNNKDGPRMVTNTPSRNVKEQVENKVKCGQLKEPSQATQPDLQTQTSSTGPELEKEADDEAKAQMTQNTQSDLSPDDEHRDDITSLYATGEPKENTETNKEENKSADMREPEEPPTSHAETDSEEETDEEAHPATKTSIFPSPDDVREEDESPTIPAQTVLDKVKKFEKKQQAEKNKDGTHVVTRNPSFLNNKGQLDKKVKSGQLEEHTEATQPDLQTQIPSKGPESEKMEDEEAKSADESSTQIIPHKPPAEEQKQDVISDQDTEKTIEETEKEKEEKKSDGMREKGELPTSSGQTDSEEETDEEAHPATKTSIFLPLMT
ncbi:protein IWS1 homolog [Oreochromis niloticus]|uniref:protein IWS1 homolog n=1 Tax=Oreochromis niloticus TaxID=8128 RepID=UPI0009052253|nr:protein IWS1 homolog [Oreochromis niloticus]